jgi:hypothetical protein
MSNFQTVVIEPIAGRYRVAQGGRTLFLIPRAVMEQFEPEAVFPPEWPSRESERLEVRRLFWEPNTLEFLMADFEAHPARLVEELGSAPYRAYLQSLWLPPSGALLTRIHWNPADPYDPFDEQARRASLRVQLQFVQRMAALRPPEHWTVVLNVVEAYLEAVGLQGGPSSPAGELLELSLTPPLPWGNREGEGWRALEAAGVALAGDCFPVVRAARFCAVHALSLRDLQAAEALLNRQGVLTKEGSFDPH